MKNDIQTEYDRLKEEGPRLGASEHFSKLSELFAGERLWESYRGLLALVPGPLAGRDIADIGCKYGHLMPLLFGEGARSAVGIDVEDVYLEAASEIVGTIWPQSRFRKSESGHLPIESNSIDVVVVNEVISHVNPGHLPTLFSEIGRVLRKGGYVIISDGNNIANEECRKDLIEVYDAWENGPDGRRTSRDVVQDCFLDIRRKLIGAWYPDLPEDRLEYIARNTSGLYGDFLRKTVDSCVAGQNFTARPYRRGDCPTNPSDGGVVMEFGFYPQQVEMALGSYGIRAHQVKPVPPVLDRRTAKLLIGSIYLVVRHRIDNYLHPDGYRGASWGFQILGVKER
jgi:SAM-dependent methyltransferase